MQKARGKIAKKLVFITKAINLRVCKLPMARKRRRKIFYLIFQSKNEAAL